MNSLKSIILVSVFSVFVISCGQTPTVSNALNSNINRSSANVTLNNTATNSSLRESKAAQVVDEVVDLYSEKCMICHKDTGKGGKITLEGKTITPADLTSAKIKARSDEKLLSQIKEGVPDEGMPSFKAKLSDDEIRSIIQKIRKF